MKLYAERDVLALKDHYLRHVSAMTAEDLYRKSDIAAELAWRDARIAELEAARRAEPDQIYKGTNRHGVDARYFEEKLRLLIRDLGNYQADELRRVFERLADATGAEPDRVSRMDVLSLSEAARCLGVAQARNDADAIKHWQAESERLESAICQKAQPAPVAQSEQEKGQC